MQTPNFIDIPYQRMFAYELKRIAKDNRIDTTGMEWGDLLAELRPRACLYIPMDLYVKLFTHTRIELPNGQVVEVHDPNAEIPRLRPACPINRNCSRNNACRVLEFYNDKTKRWESAELHAQPLVTPRPRYEIPPEPVSRRRHREEEEESEEEEEEEAEYYRPRHRRRYEEEEEEEEPEEEENMTSFIVPEEEEEEPEAEYEEESEEME